MRKKIFVTGGAGFIGSHLIKTLISHGYQVLNIDSLTYAGDLENVKSVETDPLYEFKNININNYSDLRNLFQRNLPEAIFHLAAESHVDNSIDVPDDFIQTNIIGTYNLLKCSLEYFKQKKNLSFRFIHVSTDEVYGSLGSEGKFTEQTAYDPRSPYSATKAASDHLAKAWWHTYKLPVIVTNCSNNYGPNQHREKLIPTVINNAIRGQKIPIYGTGNNIRDWLYVEDHVNALVNVLEFGSLGETYNIGGNNEISNLELVENICSIIDSKKAQAFKTFDLVEFVPDRLGHDFRYAIDANKIKMDLNWRPVADFKECLNSTVDWYLQKMD